MENTLEQNVNSEEIVEFEDDEVNTMEEKEVLESEDATDHVIEDSMIEALSKPYVGMEFESQDDAQEYYNKYARFQGFGTRRNRLTRSGTNQPIIGQEFVCSKEAHNHELATPKSTPLIRSHRKRTRVQKDLMDVLDDFDVHPSLKRQKQIEKGDAQVMNVSNSKECLNKFFKDYVNASTPVKAEASQIYTRKLFRMFQDELVHTQEYVVNRVNVDRDSKTYKVHEISREKPVYLVTFDATLNEVECNSTSLNLWVSYVDML
ncbi:hypothetical protein COLO4_15228 [Corchorus olitorius]|uniref:FAR1 domain-containing protein n=1 Tax=Corchorus olitorius TaxID=93759 RepID=A0A1R3JNZ5_9ROSI|nr:hypothetical protein COLO4_15228 [Corchorus olitorius]